MASKFSARECIPIEYIEEQMQEYAKFDHLRANAEFLDWLIKDYKDNAMANYEWEADTPQTDYPCNTCSNKGDHNGECQNCVADSAPVRWKTPSHYKPKQTDLGKPIECEGCGEHICIGCEHQAKKEAWRKAQTDCGWK